MADSKSDLPSRSSQRPKPPARPYDTTDLVLTPGGPRPRSLVHDLQPGEHVSLKDGHVRIIQTATGEVVKDLGEVATQPEGEPQAEPPGGAGQSVPALSDVGWIENAQWRNGATDPIVSFTTSWVVPPVPTSDDGQTIYLFNGMQPDSAAHILQPVLQWGKSHAGGGNYWSIANWYADGQGGSSAVKTPIRVSPGTVLQGVITCTGQSSSGYNYTCQFIGYPGVDITVTDAPELTWAYQTLECYGTYAGTNAQGVPQWNPLTQCSDYPAAPMTTMYDIEIKTGTPGTSGTDAALSWQPVTAFNDCGQNCVIVSDDSPGGAVDLYYRATSGAPTAVSWGADRIDVFALGTNNELLQWYWDSTSWNGPFEPSGSQSFGSTPAVASWGVGRLDVFARGPAGDLIHGWYDNGWNPWESLSAGGLIA
ncbi:MAG: hypothetical protein ACLP8S_33880 [Solirubrobacteraceae bacterium]